MSLAIFQYFLRSFKLSFTKKSIQNMKKILDPFNYKYKRPFNIMKPQENNLQQKKAEITEKIIQLSLFKLYFDIESQQNKTYQFNSFCQFFLENKEKIQILFIKNQKSTTDVILYLLHQMIKTWYFRADFNVQVKKNQKQLQTIVLLLKQILKDHINNFHAKQERQKIGYFKQENSLSPVSLVHSVQRAIALGQSGLISTNMSRYEAQQNGAIDVQVSFQQPQPRFQVMNCVYMGLITLRYYNDKSKSIPLNMTSSKLASYVYNSDEQESLYFHYQNYQQLLFHSLKIFFFLSSPKEIPLLSQLFCLCSHVQVYKLNIQKPVSLLRMVLYGELKLQKKSWGICQITKQEQSAYYELLQKQLMLDPNFRKKLLSVIEEWINAGVQVRNPHLTQHWTVLIHMVNKRIFEGYLQNEMFNLLINKSQGNKLNKLHVCNLLCLMVQGVTIEIIIKNNQKIFCLEQFMQQKKPRLLQIYFQHFSQLLTKHKQVSNKTIVNRIVSLYLQLKNQTKIGRPSFMDFFRQIVRKSIQSGEKLLNDTNMKRIHMVQQQNLRSTQKTTNCALEPDIRLTAPSKISNIATTQGDNQEQVQISMLKQLFIDQKKKGENYFAKFIKELHRSYFNKDNVKVYQIYGEAILNRLTESSVLNQQLTNQPIQLVSNPLVFQRYLLYYETFYEITDENKVLSEKLFKIILLTEALTQKQKLSPRHAWLIRKLKYFFLLATNKRGTTEKEFSGIELNASRRSSQESIQLHNFQGDKFSNNLWEFIRQILFKVKNKIALLVYIAAISLQYYQTNRRYLASQKIQSERVPKTEHQFVVSLCQIKRLLQKDEYCLTLSSSLYSIYAFFILYNMVVLNDFYVFTQSKSKDQEFDFIGADQNPILTQIRCILALQMDYLKSFQFNQILYMFTMKQTLGQKLSIYMNLPSFQHIPLVSRVLPIVKVVKELTYRKFTSFSQRQIILPYYNHIEFSFVNLEKNEFSNLKSDQKIYTFAFELLMNWDLKSDNFISFSTKNCRYKLVIKNKCLSLLLRRQNNDFTQKVRKYPITSDLSQKFTLQVILKKKQLSVYIDKKFIGTTNCENQIQILKLEMINGILVKKVGISRSSPEIHFNSDPNMINLDLKQSFKFDFDLQLQIKLKEKCSITFQAVCFKFPYAKFFFILKQIFKYNTQLAEQQPYLYISGLIQETFLKMLQNKSLNKVQTKTQRQIAQSNSEENQMFKTLMRFMFQVFVDLKNDYCMIRKKTQNKIRLCRKYSQETDLFKAVALIKNNSTGQRLSNYLPPIEEFLSLKKQQQGQKDLFQIPALPNVKQSRYIYSQNFTTYLCQTVLKPENWEYYSNRNQTEISQYIKALFTTEQFLTRVENQTFSLFFHLINILEKVTFCRTKNSKNNSQNSQFQYQQLPKSPFSQELPQRPSHKNLSQTLKFIILNHKTTSLLKKKFKYFFYTAQMGKSNFIKKQFYQLIDLLSKKLMLKEIKVSDSTKIGKWLFLQFEKFEFVFSNCSLQIKIRILDYLAQFQQQDKLIVFMKQLFPEVILGLKMWLLIYLKKMLFQLKMKKNVLKTMKFLGQVTCVFLTCWQQIKLQEQKQQLLKILKQEISYINQRQKANQPISKELLGILSQNQFIHFLITVIDQFILNPKRCDFVIAQFTQTVFQVIFNLEKKQLIQVLTNYRKYSNKNVGLLMYPMKLQVSKRLKVYQLSCFLQYILECVLSIQNSLSQQETSSFALALKSYLQHILRNYEQVSQLHYGLLYAYPKVYHLFNIQSKKQLTNQLNKISKLSSKQLRGGLYIKLMMIVAHLIQMKPNQDMSFIVQELIFRTYAMQHQQSMRNEQKQSLAAFRAINDFSEVQSSSKQRCYLQKMINFLTKNHRAYYLEKDQPDVPVQVISAKLVKFQEQNDLTPYCLDYFLMKLVIYLEWQDQNIKDTGLDEIYKKYSCIVLKAFQKFPMIYEDISQKNIASEVCISDYSELLLLTADQFLLVAQKVTRPSGLQLSFPNQLAPKTDQFSPKKNYLDQSQLQKYQNESSPKSNKNNKNIQLYQSQRFSKTAGKKGDQSSDFVSFINPKQVATRKKSFHISEVTKNKQALVDQLRKDHHVWRKECLKKQFNKFFRDQAKQLLVIELLFTYYVQNSVMKPKSQITNKTNQMIQKYFQWFQEQIQNYEQRINRIIIPSKHLIRIFNIRRITPYLMQKAPILKVKASGFPNMCMPILTKIPKLNYKLREETNPCHMQSFIGEPIRLDMFGIDINNTNFQDMDTQKELSLSYNPNQSTSPRKSMYEGSERSFRPKTYICLQESEFELQTKQQNKKQINYCELITRKGVYFCEWKVVDTTLKEAVSQQTSKKLKSQYVLTLQTFKSKPTQCPRLLKYGSPISNLILVQKTIQISVNEIRQVFFRKCNQIHNNSIQLFSSDGRSHLICLYSQQKAEKLVKVMSQKKATSLKVVRSPHKQFQRRQYMNKWTNGQLDNFTYLMLLNKFSGRSFCDTNQYPVFPWVIKDYKSKTLNLDDIRTYRDLTKPIGALNQKKLEKFYQKYYMQNQDTGIYLYGSHFSTSLFIYYFLVRMEPFSSLHQQMQGGSWDAPDRLFSSMEHMWESLMSPSSSTDIKQSIPEFYYFPFFLKNTNHIDLGTRQSGEPVDDVILPPWAKSPQDFIFKMRSALQSNYVSLNLPYWIDLVFGVDQKNIKRHNLYHPLSYGENIHIDKIPEKDLQARICQINFFGQHPIRLFNKSHKLKRLTINSIFARDLLPPTFMRTTSNVKKETSQFNSLIMPLGCSVVSVQHSDKSQNSSICVLKVKYHYLGTQIEIQIDPKVESVDNIGKKITATGKGYQKSKRRQSHSSQKSQQSQEKNVHDPFYLGFKQQRTSNVFSYIEQSRLVFHSLSSRKHILSSFWLQSNYSHHLYSETFIILFGEDGLCFMNWNFETIYKFTKRSVDCCYVDDLAIFIGCKEGKIYVYDIVAQVLTLIFDLVQSQERLSKPSKTERIYNLKMQVFNEKKLISVQNEDEYRIVVVTNQKKLSILNHRIIRRNWANIQEE